MTGLKTKQKTNKNGHIRKSFTENDEASRSNRERRRKKKKNTHLTHAENTSLTYLSLLIIILKRSQLYLWGSPFWVKFCFVFCLLFFFFFVSCCFCLFCCFCICDRVNPTIEVATIRFRRWCMLGVFVAGIHPSRTWMSGSFESVRWNACVHRLPDLSLYSHPKEFLGNGVRTMLTPREKSPLLEAQRRVKPATLYHAGQRAQHTTDWAILAKPIHSKIKLNIVSSLRSRWRCSTGRVSCTLRHVSQQFSHGWP